MNIWQKRLIKFIFKVIGAFILFIVIALFLYYQLYFKKDNLIKFIPEQAVFYSTFRLNTDLRDNKFINNLITQYNGADIDWHVLNQFVRYNAAFAVIPNTEKENIEFDYLLVFNLNKSGVKLQKYLDYIDEYNWSYHLLTNSALERKILIVSNSESVIDQVKKINSQEIPSLVSNINVVVNLRNISSDHIGKIYLNFQDLTQYIDKIPDFSHKLALASLKSDNINELFLGVKSEKNKLVLTNIKKIKDFKSNQLILAKIPQNFSFNHSFFNGQSKLKDILAALKDIDPQFWQQIEQNNQYFEGLYELDINQDILELFNNQAQIVVTRQNNWVLALKLGDNRDFSTMISKLEDIIKQYIAINNPVERQKQLPDYTYITQIVKDTSDLDFKYEDLANFSLTYIKKDNIEFAYLIKEDTLYLANSRQLLKDLSQEYQLIDISKQFCGDLTSLSQNILINNHFEQLTWLNLKQISINDNLASKQEICLILE